MDPPLSICKHHQDKFVRQIARDGSRRRSISADDVYVAYRYGSTLGVVSVTRELSIMVRTTFYQDQRLVSTKATLGKCYFDQYSTADQRISNSK